MSRPKCRRIPNARFKIGGFFGDYIDGITDQWLLVAPKGTIVDRHFMRIIQNYMSTYSRNPFPERIEALVKVRPPVP